VWLRLPREFLRQMLKHDELLNQMSAVIVTLGCDRS